MAQLVNVRLTKSEQQPLGFRLQGGKDFGTPLIVQKVNGGSAAERAGLQAGDALIRVNNTDVYTLRHQDAQDAIRAAGGNLELTVQRGGGTWRPAVTPTGSLPRPGRPLGATPSPVTSTSLRATPKPTRAFGSGHNSVAKPFGYMNGGDSVKSIVNKQYNTPVGMYSEQSIAETLSAQSEVLAGGVLGVNFKKNEKTYDAEKSAVFKMLQENKNDPEPELSVANAASPVSGLRHVTAPVTRPDAPINNTGGLPPGQNICEECERLITGVFVRIKDKNLHVECFKCATCGSSLKNQGYYNLNGKLYCDIHAKLVARQHPPAPNLEPVTVPPGARIPTNTYSTPLPPLTTTNYANGSSSMFSPSSNLSGPKPFGSSLGSAYSPSLSPRSAPLSPARPVAAPAPMSAPAPTHAPPFAPTNDHQIRTYSPKTEYKSAAEERLIRKMAKMALNGYEIGIQRKIKPADHIQSMADKIQDTVVSKHPLNTDNLGDSIFENLLNKSSGKTTDKFNKTSGIISNLSDKIKDVVVNKHPTAKFTNSDIPIPPPIPDTPVPVLSSLIIKPNNNVGDITFHCSSLKNSEDDIIYNNSYKTNNGFKKAAQGEEKNDSFKKDTNKYSHIIENGIPELTTKHSTLERPFFVKESNNKQNFILENYNNKNSIENYCDKLSPNNGSDINEEVHKHDYKYNTVSNTLKKRNLYENSLNNVTNKSTMKDLSNQQFDNSSDIGNDPENSLCDNTLYHFKPTFNSTHNKLSNGNGSDTKINEQNEKKNLEVSSKNENVEKEGVVRRRQKKTDNTDGKRDSRIIPRPPSTMTSVDVTDGLYPVCHICDKTISRGPFITALGRIWCPEHFICVNATCRRALQDIGFVEENGQLYCEFCFEQYIAPACDKCHAKIKGDCLNAIGKHFHPECFNCVYCGKLFGNNPFFLEDGLPYCEADWNELFTTKCFACGFPVEAGDRWVEALNNNYHSQCFNCTVCKKNLEGQSFFAKGGRPFCKVHAR